jgi:hypothetical protein
MKERRERTMREMLEDQSLDAAIKERFRLERQGADTVDGIDRWDGLDLFAEGESA